MPLETDEIRLSNLSVKNVRTEKRLSVAVRWVRKELACNDPSNVCLAEMSDNSDKRLVVE